MKFPDLRSQKTLLAFFAFLLFILLVKLKTFYNYYDEGFAMTGAMRVVNGEIPYRDFWGLYPPGQFYALAAVMKIFGPNLLYARLYDTLVRFLMGIAIFQIARRLASLKLAYWIALVSVMMLASLGFYAYAVFPALALSLWAYAFCLAYLEDGRPAHLYWTGAALGLSALFRWDIAVYTAAGLLVGVYLYLLDQRRHEAAGAFRFSLLFAPFGTLWRILAPLFLIALPLYGLVGLFAGWRNLYEQLFYFPAVALHSVRWLPYPALIPAIQTFRFYDVAIMYIEPPSEDWLRFYLPLLTIGLGLVGLVVAAVRTRLHLRRGHFVILSLALSGGLLFNQALSRYDQIHVAPASIVTFLAAAAFLGQFAPAGTRTWLRATFWTLFIALSVLYFNPALKELLNTLDSAAPWGCYSANPRAGCAVLAEDEAKAVDYIQAVTTPSDAIYVGNQKHDRIFVNDAGFYFLAGRPAGTRYDELHPGVATTLPVQTEIAAQLEARRVEWAVLVKIWESTEPNGSAVSSGVTYLDDYLHAHFAFVAEFGNYQVWQRAR